MTEMRVLMTENHGGAEAVPHRVMPAKTKGKHGGDRLHWKPGVGHE
jgi:hypothetical protein